MKILHCITGLSGDGAQRMLLRLVRGLESQGIENVVVSLAGPGQLAAEFEALGVPVYALGMSGPAGFIAGVVALRRLVREVCPDLIQGWMYHANVLSLLSRDMRGSRLPVLWNIRRGLDDLQERKATTQAIIRGSAWTSSWASRIIYCSERSRAQHEAAGFSSSASCVLGNGFDTGLFAPSEEARARVRQELGLAPQDFVIGNVGRFDIAKGHHFLFEAFCAFAEGEKRAHLVCIGRGLERSMLPESAPEDVLSRIHLLPERSGMHGVFPAFDVYCSSSIAEGFPNVIAEALASALPVLATDTGATKSLIGSHGVLVEPRSSKALLEGLRALASEPESQRRARGVAGRSLVVQEHSLGRVVGSYRDLYEAELGGASGTRFPSEGESRGSFFEA